MLKKQKKAEKKQKYEEETRKKKLNNKIKEDQVLDSEKSRFNSTKSDYTLVERPKDFTIEYLKRSESEDDEDDNFDKKWY